MVPIVIPRLHRLGAASLVVVGRPEYLGQPCETRCIKPNQPTKDVCNLIRSQALGGGDGSGEG